MSSKRERLAAYVEGLLMPFISDTDNKLALWMISDFAHCEQFPSAAVLDKLYQVFFSIDGETNATESVDCSLNLLRLFKQLSTLEVSASKMLCGGIALSVSARLDSCLVVLKQLDEDLAYVEVGDGESNSEPSDSESDGSDVVDSDREEEENDPIAIRRKTLPLVRIRLQLLNTLLLNDVRCSSPKIPAWNHKQIDSLLLAAESAFCLGFPNEQQRHPTVHLAGCLFLIARMVHIVMEQDGGKSVVIAWPDKSGKFEPYEGVYYRADFDVEGGEELLGSSSGARGQSGQSGGSRCSRHEKKMLPFIMFAGEASKYFVEEEIEKEHGCSGIKLSGSQVPHKLAGLHLTMECVERNLELPPRLSKLIRSNAIAQAIWSSGRLNKMEFVGAPEVAPKLFTSLSSALSSSSSSSSSSVPAAAVSSLSGYTEVTRPRKKRRVSFAPQVVMSPRANSSAVGTSYTPRPKWNDLHFLPTEDGSARKAAAVEASNYFGIAGCPGHCVNPTLLKRLQLVDTNTCYITQCKVNAASDVVVVWLDRKNRLKFISHKVYQRMCKYLRDPTLKELEVAVQQRCFLELLWDRLQVSPESGERDSPLKISASREDLTLDTLGCNQDIIEVFLSCSEDFETFAHVLECSTMDSVQAWMEHVETLPLPELHYT
jgi:hypothetical protein